ncbi:MAG: glycine oxidase ThiO [Sorangiineae bacterium]|nr:glycine oxidase ThiO [Sorangiineae bacterium]
MKSASRKRGERHVVIVGAGAIGCASAWCLARRGVRVTVLERGEPGGEASTAAAGILGAQAEAHGPGPMTELALLARARYPRWVAELRRLTRIDVGYRESGLLRVGLDRATATLLVKAARWQARQGLGVTALDGRRARALEPALSPAVAGGVRFDDAHLEPRAFFAALRGAALAAGARIVTGVSAASVLIEGERAVGVALDDGSRLVASDVVVAAGSFTTLLGGLPLAADAVRPARGQIIELRSPAPLIRQVVFGPRCYLVPRDDGRTAVGSTLEFVGFQRGVTAAAVQALLAAAIELVPGLASAALAGAWSGFRPWTPDELPLIGSPGVERLIIASGHYRNGILLTPITAELVTALVLGRRPALDLTPFAPGRALPSRGPAGVVGAARNPA